jgi:hypothetical protein
MHYPRPIDLLESPTVRDGTEDVSKRHLESPDPVSSPGAPGEGTSRTEAVTAPEKIWSDYRNRLEAALVRDLAKRLRDHQAETQSKIFFLTIVEPRTVSAGLSLVDRRALTARAAKIHGNLRGKVIRLYRHLNKLMFSNGEIERQEVCHLFLAIDDEVIKGSFNMGRANGPHIHGLLSVPGQHVERFERWLRNGNLTAMAGRYIDGVETFHVEEVRGDLETAIDYSLKYIFTLREAEADTHNPWQYHPKDPPGQNL